MDIVRKNEAGRGKLALVFKGVVVCIVVFLSYKYISQYSKFSVKREDIVVGKVSRGDLEVRISGNGVLLPEFERWISASVSGKVREVYVQLGTFVEVGQPLISLENIDVLQEVEDNMLEIEAAEAEYEAAEVGHDTKILDQGAKIKTIELNMKSAVNRYEAEKKLFSSGNGSISLLDHQSSKLKVDLFENEFEIEKMRLLIFEKNKKADLKAFSARMNILRNKLNRAMQKASALSIEAQMAGVVQEIPFELGQNIEMGENLVKIANMDSLKAELKITERKVNDVKIGQEVLIDTRKSIVNGVVSRIDPAVINGVVLVGVDFKQKLPPEARPDLSVVGEIVVADVQDTLYVRRPVDVRSNYIDSVYVLDKYGKTAVKSEVKFGVGSLNKIQILEGLSEGDKIIISDRSSLKYMEKIAIN